MWLVSHSYCLCSYCLFFLILMSFFLENISKSRYAYTCGGISVKEPTYQCKRHNETGVQSLAQEDPLEEDMTTHSSVLAWRIPWTEEPGGLQSIGSQRLRQDWSNLASMHTYRHICFSFKCKRCFCMKNYENFSFLRNYSYDQYIKSFLNPFYIFIIIHLKINQNLFHQFILIK